MLGGRGPRESAYASLPVRPMGTLRSMPFRQAKGRLWGPGVLDMKSGLAFFVFAMRALRDLDIPVARKVVLQINSADVAHSWWIPSLGGKADAIPGHNNYTWFKISKPGIYHGQCAELCGNNHADMRAEVRAVPPDQFQAWVTKQRLDILASQQALAAARKAGQGS